MEFVPMGDQELWIMCSGTMPMSLPSGNSLSLNHPMYEIPKETSEPMMWKCEGCGKVHKVEDTLECTACGSQITEKSRFVLLRE
jgi:DNA-directed RNA polymerase subunit RPC12/RpoP